MVEKIRYTREGRDYVPSDTRLCWQKGLPIERITPTEVIMGGGRPMRRSETVDNYLYRNVDWDDGPT